jgi:hypothetical protein
LGASKGGRVVETGKEKTNYSGEINWEGFRFSSAERPPEGGGRVCVGWGGGAVGGMTEARMMKAGGLAFGGYDMWAIFLRHGLRWWAVKPRCERGEWASIKQQNRWANFGAFSGLGPVSRFFRQLGPARV